MKANASSDLKVTALAPWFGSNRSLAHKVGELLAGCSWVGVPFAGGMSELARIGARTLLVSDLHDHVLNLAAVVADPKSCDELRRLLDAMPVHPDLLKYAQVRCRNRESVTAFAPDRPDVDWAVDYFACAWMARNGTAGTGREFEAGMSVRWDGAGGDSAVRFRNSTASLAEWSKVMRRCTFAKLDVFDFLDRVKDRAGHGVYLDPPFPGVGDRYKHAFDEPQQRRLAARLAELTACRVVCRFYEHELVEELYPASAWDWNRYVGGRTQTNKAAPEVMLVNRCAAGCASRDDEA